MDWLEAQDFADTHDMGTYRQICRHARSYMTGHTAVHPILRRKGRGVWVYAVDPNATWRGRHLRQLKRDTDLGNDDIADALGYATPQSVWSTIRQDRWVSRPYQSAIGDLFDAHDLTPTDDPDAKPWYAVCDSVCGRMVVQKVRTSESAARDLLGSPHCREAIVKGHGPPPEVGWELERGTVICSE